MRPHTGAWKLNYHAYAMTGRCVAVPPSFFGRVVLTYGVVEQMFGRGSCGITIEHTFVWNGRRCRLCVWRCCWWAGVIESVTAVAAAGAYGAARGLVAGGLSLVAVGCCSWAVAQGDSLVSD